MKTKSFKAAFVVTFIIMLLTPLLSTDLRNGAVSVEENRMLADRPPLSSINHPRTFIKDFNKWFDDHVGFREKFISLYRIFNKLQRKGPQYREGNLTYITGKKGHHFFTGYNNEMTAKFSGKPIFSDKQLETFAQKLKTVKSFLDKEGILLIVMFCTDKESVYPEYYPESIRQGPEPIQLDFITDYLKNNASIDVFNIRRALLDQKGRYPLYPKGPLGDLTHYNEIGAFFAYRELLEHVNVYFPEIAPLSLDDIDISCDENGTAGISLIKEPSYKKLDAGFFDAVNVFRPLDNLDEAFENTCADTPTILFLGDSYMGHNGKFISKYIAQNFGRVIFFNFRNIKNLPQYISTFSPGIVVLETAERQIGGFFHNLNRLTL
ncbi:MAG: hypothetical protein LBS06_04180 [Treponema sp.]|jgi:hypothetical protein|nr:hypothetical protein [Treponema sp.]